MPKKKMSYDEHIELGKLLKKMKSECAEVFDTLQKAYGKTHITTKLSKEVDDALNNLKCELDGWVQRETPLDDKSKDPRQCYYGDSSKANGLK